MSTARDTYQRPSPSRDTVTVEGSRASGSTPGQDHTNVGGPSCLARCRRPSHHRNADRGYCADRLPVRDLNRGYRARLAKKFANAFCWVRSACCSGTLETSDRYASSGRRFIAVRFAFASGTFTERPSWCQRLCRHTRVSFPTLRTHPNVRARFAAYPPVEYARHLNAVPIHSLLAGTSRPAKTPIPTPGSTTHAPLPGSYAVEQLPRRRCCSG
jgi:hypothetical protein